jgi:hypothetical protein
VIIGTDSAITVAGPNQAVMKVYNDADKIFAFYADADKDDRLPIGVATYGLATLGQRTIQSFVRQFELEHKAKAKELQALTVHEFAEKLHAFFRGHYVTNVGPFLQAQGIDIATATPDKLPALGLFVSGFSPKEPLPETWLLNIQLDKTAGGIVQSRQPGNFGSNWGGQFLGIQRFHKGYEDGVIQAAAGAIASAFGIDLTQPGNQDKIRNAIMPVLPMFEYQVPFAAMPLQEGVDYTTFLLDMAILQHRFVVGAPTCGGSIRLAVIRKHEGFQWVNSPSLAVKGSRYV